jgi:hypothetical protein
VALLVLPAFAAEDAPEPPHPRPNPSVEAEPNGAVDAEDAAAPDDAVEPEDIPRPEPSPLDEEIPKPEPSPLDEEVPGPEPSPFGEEVPPEPVDEEELAECEAELRKLGGTFERLPTIDGEGTCGMAAPYRLDRVGRDVRLEPASRMTCETALAFARWVNRVVVPATDALGDDTRLTRIRHGSTYICRTRNNQEGAKISFHALGLAIDVVLFEFDGHAPIAISPRAGDGNLEESFQRAVRGGACLYFTTVLGPGTDASHGDNLHLDVAERRGGYRLCQ